ncbi:MAG: bcsG [Burkholderiaceae bacterium]|nr:bcsG [Burkholderiaceae bacterium]
MGDWSLYFFAKLCLYYGGFIGFHWLPNLVFAIVLAFPLEVPLVRRARTVLAIPLAIVLLYYDSWLPSFGRVASQAGALLEFDRGYLLELLGRFVNPYVLAGMIFLTVAHLLLRQRVRLATFAFAGILSVPLAALIGSWQIGGAPDANRPAAASASASVSASASASASAPALLEPSAQLEAFYAAERQRRVALPSIRGSRAPFDVVLLHVCSLSWDDLAYLGESGQPLLNRFDAVFRQFNAASTYSGPSILRVLRSTCGQARHDEMYQGVANECSLIHNFDVAGFEVHGLLNHNGEFDNFARTLRGYGGLRQGLDDNRHAPEAMRAFDNSPVYADGPLLAGWLQQHGKSARPLALYYNTITLHDGNRVPGAGSSSTLATFKPRLTRLLADLDRFISQLEQRGRPVVVLFVPEHGAGLRGDRMQIAGMREIPSPAVTLVPAAVKLIGAKQAATAQPLVVDKPLSHFALGTLLAGFVADNPFAGDGGQPLAQRLQALPETPFVSENANIVVMRRGDGYLMRSPAGNWTAFKP